MNTLGAQNVCGGRDRVGGCEYNPLYKNGMKKTQNNSVETTLLLKRTIIAINNPAD